MAGLTHHHVSLRCARLTRLGSLTSPLLIASGLSLCQTLVSLLKDLDSVTMSDNQVGVSYIEHIPLSDIILYVTSLVMGIISI